MHIVMSPRFLEEAERYRLAFTCEECAHFDPESEACAIRYPTADHRRDRVMGAPDGERVFFCKMFESV
jgi:hypothetical protein